MMQGNKLSVLYRITVRIRLRSSKREIVEKLGATWFVGTIGYLNATLTGAVGNQHVRARAPLNSEAVSAGIATMKLHLESGAVADSGAAVCLSAIVVEKMGFRSANLGTDVRVYGYLIER